MMVDTKNGDSYEGTLGGCDLFMNLKLTKVIITSQSGQFARCDEVFIRGNNIKSIQFSPEVLEKHLVEVKKRQAEALESKQTKRQEKYEKKQEERNNERLERFESRGRGFSDRGRGRGFSDRGRGRIVSEPGRGRGF